MQTLPLIERTALAEKIQSTRERVAEGITEEFFERHPDWLERYGARGRKLGIEDAIYHQNYLACAVEVGSTIPFVDYVRWTVKMLGARKIAAHFVSENLEQLGCALEGFLTPVESDFVTDYINAACRATEDCADPVGVKAEDPSEMALTCKVYLRAAIQGDRRTATSIALEALRRAADPVDIYVDLFQASQYEVGRMWQLNEITVAEEHMATAITQYVMAQLYDRLERPAGTRGRLVITGIEGEFHQIGANMVADVFEARGWDVRFLGTNVPEASILKAIEAHSTDAVGISATMLLSIPKVVQLVGAIKARFTAKLPRIFLGGYAFRSASGLAEELGATGVAKDLRSALTLI